MRRPPTLLIVARDPGAASALTSIAERGRARVVAFPDAARVFARAGLAHEELEADAAADIVEGTLSAVRPDVLVTGTSRDPAGDGLWWAAARRAGIPTLAVLDHWTHYSERFTVRLPFDTSPDRIAVMDERASTALIAAGCPSDRIVITGHPALEDALAPPPASARPATRRDWAATEREWVILFASEPIASDYRGTYAFDENDALSVLIEAARGISRRLVVRPHPRQSADQFQRRFSGIIIDRTTSPRAAMHAADTVVGMTSMFLLEAALTGAPVLSIQPEGRGIPVPGGNDELVAIARTAAETAVWLADPHNRVRLTEELRTVRNTRCGYVPGATARVLAEADRLAATTGRTGR